MSIAPESAAPCLTPAVRLDGAEVTLIEGLAKGDQLHPLQQAFIDQDGSAEEIREFMSGDICPCGCYVKIVRAVEQTATRGK